MKGRSILSHRSECLIQTLKLKPESYATPFFFKNKQNKETYEPADRKEAYIATKNMLKEVRIKNYHQFFFKTHHPFVPTPFQRELLDDIKKNPSNSN
jgi:hypothetical protein